MAVRPLVCVSLLVLGGAGACGSSGSPAAAPPDAAPTDAAATPPSDGAVKPAGNAGKACGTMVFTDDRVPPEALLVFDRSAPMAQPVAAGIGTTRFADAVAA